MLIWLGIYKLEHYCTELFISKQKRIINTLTFDLNQREFSQTCTKWSYIE